MPKAITKEKVQKASNEDTTLLALKGCIHQGWFDAKAENLQAYKHVFSKLAVVDGIVLRGDRIVLQTKQLLRAHVWFPGMDSLYLHASTANPAHLNYIENP